jgi:hypothetical protein
MSRRAYPFDVFATSDFPAPLGQLIERVRPVSMFPPYPWGQWTYGRVFSERCGELPGDVLEAGVGMGGMSFFFALLSEQLGHDRLVFSVDTFDGLPAPDAQRDNPYFREGLYGPESAQSDPLSALFAKSDNAALECFQMRAAEFGVSERVVAVQGLFEDVLPDVAPGRTFSFVHIDGDLFSSVYSALDALWDRVDEGGVVAIDDFFHPGQGPLRATAQFFNERGATPVYHVAYPYSVFLIKEEWGRPTRAVDGNAYSLEWLRNDARFIEALRTSLRNSRGDARAKSNCKLLLDVLREPAHEAEIYDYWRSLEQFWSSIDVRPEEWAVA